MTNLTNDRNNTSMHTYHSAVRNIFISLSFNVLYIPLLSFLLHFRMSNLDQPATFDLAETVMVSNKTERAVPVTSPPEALQSVKPNSASARDASPLPRTSARRRRGKKRKKSKGKRKTGVVGLYPIVPQGESRRRAETGGGRRSKARRVVL